MPDPRAPNKSASRTQLRKGFTSGTYTAATATAAWRCLQGLPPADRIDLYFPDGRVREVNVDGTLRHGNRRAEAWAVKHAGDDPDITNKATVRAEISPAELTDNGPEDFVEPCGRGTVILRGKSGIGRVERKGLDVPPGKWAINPGPRRMIIENLRRNGLGDSEQAWLISLSIDHGERLARRTLNPIIGIEGGLSILGTSGIVHPCSHAAYKETIRVMIRGAAQTNLTRVALVTGGRTHRWTRDCYPDLTEPAIVRIGDFIQESLAYCADFGIRQVTITCMRGKLAKYAMGLTCTHAHQAAMSMPGVGNLLKQGGLPATRAMLASDCATVREYFELLSPEEQSQAESILRTAALANFNQWAPGVSIGLEVMKVEGKTA